MCVCSSVPKQEDRVPSDAWDGLSGQAPSPAEWTTRTLLGASSRKGGRGSRTGFNQARSSSTALSVSPVSFLSSSLLRVGAT